MITWLFSSVVCSVVQTWHGSGTKIFCWDWEMALVVKRHKQKPLVADKWKTSCSVKEQFGLLCFILVWSFLIISCPSAKYCPFLFNIAIIKINSSRSIRLSKINDRPSVILTSASRLHFFHITPQTPSAHFITLSHFSCADSVLQHDSRRLSHYRLHER